MYVESRNPFFSVSRESITTESGITLDKEALINVETGDVLGLVSKGYEVIENENVSNLFDEAINGLSVAKTIDHLDATTKRWKRQIIFDDSKINFEILPDDTTGMMLEVFNGLDGRTSFGYNLMGYRWLCTNGQVMGKNTIFSESFAHFVENPEKLKASFEVKFGAFEKNVLEWKEWTQIPFIKSDFDRFVDLHTKPENVKKVKKEQYLSPKIGNTIKDYFDKALNEQNLDENKYGAFNVLTYMGSHETKARKGSNLFSARKNTMDRLAGDFYSFIPESKISSVVPA